jgi:2-succinyl-5-enolpyruvyl-6-hydroxy-3-cyclohexene-1-carboxylate synthase
VEGFEKIFGTPHNLDLTKIASAFGLTTLTVTKQSELITELSKPVIGLSLVLVQVPDRESNADNLQAIYSSIDSI